MLYGAALNRYSCPGWSFYRHAGDPRRDTGVQEALRRTDAPAWAATEWMLEQPPADPEAWRQGLENTLVDPRLRYVCIFNWEGIADNPGALEGIRRVLAAGR